MALAYDESKAGLYNDQTGTYYSTINPATNTVTSTADGSMAPSTASTERKAVVPVVSADKALEDFNAKQATYQNIQQGVATQAQINNQTNLQNQTLDATKTQNDSLTQLKDTLTEAPEQNSYQKGLADIQKAGDLALKDYQAKVAQIQNGTFPLTTDQQAMVDGLRRQFDSLVSQQKVANKNFEGGMTNFGIATGLNRYAPPLSMGLIQQAVDNGIAKIADLEVKAASAMAELRMGFQDRNYQMINDSYRVLTDSLNQKTNILKDMNEEVRYQSELAYKKQQDEINRQKEAQETALKYGITSPFYSVDGRTAIDTRTGELLNYDEYIRRGGTGDFKDIQQISADKINEKALVMELANEYFDAGVLLTDDLQTAQQKILGSSRIYREKVRPPGSESGSDTTIKFSTDAKQRLLATGLTSADIDNIQKDINQYGIDAVIEGLPENQATAIRNVLSGMTPTQEANADSKLTRESIASSFGIEDNDERSGFLGWWGETNQEKLDGIMETIKKYQDLGYTDAQILKEMDE